MMADAARPRHRNTIKKVRRDNREPLSEVELRVSFDLEMCNML